MGRGGKKKASDEPERRCIATGKSGGKSGLIRFVIGPEDCIYPDLAGKLPGRGIWVAAERAALKKAVKKGLFARAARQPVTVPETLLEKVEAGLAERVVGLISLSRKAGGAVAGFEKVKDWLEKGEAEVLIQASDGSERGKSKLRPPEEQGRFIGVLTAAELGLAFGRENVIHGALSSGGLTARVVEEAARLAAIRETAEYSSARKDTKTT